MFAWKTVRDGDPIIDLYKALRHTRFKSVDETANCPFKFIDTRTGLLSKKYYFLVESTAVHCIMHRWIIRNMEVLPWKDGRSFLHSANVFKFQLFTTFWDDFSQLQYRIGLLVRACWFQVHDQKLGLIRLILVQFVGVEEWNSNVQSIVLLRYCVVL